MINPIHSNLYKLTSKKYLLSLLHIHNRQFLKQSYVSKQISPYIQTDPKPRLIEVPSEELKTIQRHIKNELNNFSIISALVATVPKLFFSIAVKRVASFK